MFRRNLLFAAALLLLWPLAAQAKPFKGLQLPVNGIAARYLDELQLLNPEDFPADDDTHVVSANDGRIIVKLGLGETLNKVISLQSHAGSHEFKIEHSYETSLTLINERPHMDLLAWRHHRSEWVELPRNEDSNFVAHEVNSTTFPAVTTDEIVAAVALESAKWTQKGYAPGKRWLTVAKECKSAGSYPCGVAISKVFLRIMVKIAEQWQQILLIEFIAPMGC